MYNASALRVNVWIRVCAHTCKRVYKLARKRGEKKKKKKMAAVRCGMRVSRTSGNLPVQFLRLNETGDDCNLVEARETEKQREREREKERMNERTHIYNNLIRRKKKKSKVVENDRTSTKQLGRPREEKNCQCKFSETISLAIRGNDETHNMRERRKKTQLQTELHFFR